MIPSTLVSLLLGLGRRLAGCNLCSCLDIVEVHDWVSYQYVFANLLCCLEQDRLTTRWLCVSCLILTPGPFFWIQIALFERSFVILPLITVVNARNKVYFLENIFTNPTPDRRRCSPQGFIILAHTQGVTKMLSWLYIFGFLNNFEIKIKNTCFAIWVF